MPSFVIEGIFHEGHGQELFLVCHGHDENALGREEGLEAVAIRSIDAVQLTPGIPC